MMVKSKRAIVLAIILILALPVYSTLVAAAGSNTYLPLVFKYIPPTPTKNPMPGPTQTSQPPTTGNVVITYIFYDGSGNLEPDEYVEIRNDDIVPIQLSGWTLRDIANHNYTFPNFVMQTGQICRVYTNENHPEWCGFNYGSASAIWNNTGDCGYLRNSANTLIDQYCY